MGDRHLCILAQDFFRAGYPAHYGTGGGNSRIRQVDPRLGTAHPADKVAVGGGDAPFASR